MIRHAFAMKRVNCDIEVNLFQKHSSSKYLMLSKLFDQAIPCNYQILPFSREVIVQHDVLFTGFIN